MSYWEGYCNGLVGMKIFCSYYATFGCNLPIIVIKVLGLAKNHNYSGGIIMGDGIKIVTQKAEQAEIERAQTCTPRKPDFSKQGDQGEYCCPFDGTQYKLDADGPAFYWNQVNKGGQPDAGNKSVKLANGSMCQRWEVKK